MFAAATWKRKGFNDPAAAEAFGVYLAMELAYHCGFLDVQFESDNERIIQILTRKKNSPNSYVGNIIKGIRLRMGKFRRVTFSHVGRKGNGPAHKLAQYALAEPNKVWLEDIPPCIVQEVHWDMFN